MPIGDDPLKKMLALHASVRAQDALLKEAQRLALDYLVYVKATGITSLAEAFAVGYQCAHEENA